MENDWVKVFETGRPVEASIVVSMLQENGIEAVEMNKVDSSYTLFGKAEIYCRAIDVEQARQLISTNYEE